MLEKDRISVVGEDKVILRELEEDGGYLHRRKLLRMSVDRIDDANRTAAAVLPPGVVQVDGEVVKGLVKTLPPPVPRIHNLTLGLARWVRDLPSVDGDRPLSQFRQVKTFISHRQFPIQFSWTIMSIWLGDGTEVTLRLDGKHSSDLLCLEPGMIREWEKVVIWEYSVKDPDLGPKIARLAYVRHNSPISTKSTREITVSQAMLTGRLDDVPKSSFPKIASAIDDYVEKKIKGNRKSTSDDRAQLLAGRNLDFVLMAAYLCRNTEAKIGKAIAKRDSLLMMYAVWIIDEEACLAFWLGVRDGKHFNGAELERRAPARLALGIMEDLVTTPGGKRQATKISQNVVSWEEYTGKIRYTWNRWCQGKPLVSKMVCQADSLYTIPKPSDARERLLDRPILRELLDLIYAGREKDAHARYKEHQEGVGLLD